MSVSVFNYLKAQIILTHWVSTLEAEQVVKKSQMTAKADRAAARKENNQCKTVKEAERAAYQTRENLFKLQVL